MMRDEIGYEVLECSTVRIDLRQSRHADALSGADIGLLVGDEISRNEKAVLEIVDPGSCCFTIRDGAKVTRDLESSFVSLLRCSRKFSARDVHVRLERRCTRIRPEIDHALRICCVLQLVHLRNSQSGTLQIRRSRIDPRTRLFPLLYRLCNVELTVTTHVSGGTHRSHAAGEIQPCETFRQICVMVRGGRVEQMLVHHHQPGNDCLSCQIKHLCVTRYLHRCRCSILCDIAVTQDQRLVLARCSAGSVYHTDVSQRHDWSSNTYVLLDVWRKYRLLS